MPTIPRTFHMTQGDLTPPIQATLLNELEQPVDLTAMTAVKFLMKRRDGTIKVNGNAVLVGPAVDSKVKYQWVALDVDTPGDYDGEFEVTWSDGSKTTFPNNGYILVRIKRQLG